MQYNYDNVSILHNFIAHHFTIIIHIINILLSLTTPKELLIT